MTVVHRTSGEDAAQKKISDAMKIFEENVTKEDLLKLFGDSFLERVYDYANGLVDVLDPVEAGIYAALSTALVDNPVGHLARTRLDGIREKLVDALGEDAVNHLEEKHVIGGKETVIAAEMREVMDRIESYILNEMSDSVLNRLKCLGEDILRLR